MTKLRQFSLKHLAILMTLACLAFGSFQAWYTAERESWFEANTGLYRVDYKFQGWVVRSWFDRSGTHSELLSLINKHELQYDETWLHNMSFSRKNSLVVHADHRWFELLESVYTRTYPEKEPIGVELLKIYLAAEKTPENLEPLRQQLLEKLNELIGPQYRAKRF